MCEREELVLVFSLEALRTCHNLLVIAGGGGVVWDRRAWWIFFELVFQILKDLLQVTITLHYDVLTHPVFDFCRC